MAFKFCFLIFVKGFQGDNGDESSRGLTGEKGIQGDHGLKGLKGEKGNVSVTCMGGGGGDYVGSFLAWRTLYEIRKV